MENIMVLCLVACAFCDFVQCASLSKREANVDNRLHMPRALSENDSFTVKGKLNSEKQSLAIRLMKGTDNGLPDPDNIPCLVKMYFPYGDSGTDTVTISSIIEGKNTEEMDQFIESTELFKVNHLNAQIDVKNNKIEITLNQQPLTHECKLSEGIKFLEIAGDVHKIEQMDFIFG